jgi:hypothetical protein
MTFNPYDASNTPEKIRAEAKKWANSKRRGDEMSQHFHISISISGMMKYSREEFESEYGGVFEDDNGNALTYDEVMSELKKEIEKGHRLIPCGNCDNFDYQRGCQGHEEVMK